MAFVDIGLDLQILICTLLHPSDILTLRKTCKTLQVVTRQRTIWIDALHRVCLENTLFSPSFPIPDMSDVELELAAIAPRRWIKLSTPPAARGPSGREVSISGRIGPSITTRTLDNPPPGRPRVILVPGGRYLVCFTRQEFGIWDLGNLPSADCKLIASVANGNYKEYPHSFDTCDVHATPDGMGLVLSVHREGEAEDSYEFYEIYPQGENPQFTKIACLNIDRVRTGRRTLLSPGKVIWFTRRNRQETCLRVWDYRLNTSASFLARVDVEVFSVKVVATQTAIIIFNEEAIYIWAIPPLLPQPLDLDDDRLTQFPSTIKVKYPDSLSLPVLDITFQTLSSWYFVDSSKPLYFDKVYARERPPQIQRFELIIEPDLSNATLHFINTFRLHDKPYDLTSPGECQLCEDTLVTSWTLGGDLYSGSTLSHPISNGKLAYITKIFVPIYMPRGLSFCPASGRIVYSSDEPSFKYKYKITIKDFLPHQRRL